MLRSLSVLVSLHFDGTVVDLYQLALLGQDVEMVTLWFSSDLSPSGKFMIDGILNTICCSALESLTISDLYSMDIVQPMELLSTQALPMPPLRSVKLSRFECAKFVEHFDFTHLLALDIISLRNCKSPMALLRFLLPSRKQNSNVWPLLRVIAASHFDLEKFDGLRKIISRRRACGKPMQRI